MNLWLRVQTDCETTHPFQLWKMADLQDMFKFKWRCRGSCTTSYLHLKVFSCLEALSCAVTFHFNDTVAFHSRFFLWSSKFCARRQGSQSTLWWLGTASANRAWLNTCVTRRSAKQVPGGLFLSKLCVWKKVAPEQYDTCMDACKGNGPNKHRPSYAQRVQQVCSDGLDMWTLLFLGPTP